MANLLLHQIRPATAQGDDEPVAIFLGRPYLGSFHMPEHSLVGPGVGIGCCRRRTSNRGRPVSSDSLPGGLWHTACCSTLPIVSCESHYARADAQRHLPTASSTNSRFRKAARNGHSDIFQKKAKAPQRTVYLGIIDRHVGAHLSAYERGEYAKVMQRATDEEASQIAHFVAVCTIHPKKMVGQVEGEAAFADFISLIKRRIAADLARATAENGHDGNRLPRAAEELTAQPRPDPLERDAERMAAQRAQTRFDSEVRNPLLKLVEQMPPEQRIEVGISPEWSLCQTATLDDLDKLRESAPLLGLAKIMNERMQQNTSSNGGVASLLRDAAGGIQRASNGQGQRGLGSTPSTTPQDQQDSQEIAAFIGKIDKGFLGVAAERGEQISPQTLKRISLQLLLIRDTMGEQLADQHLAYELKRYRAQGLRTDHLQERSKRKAEAD